MDHDDDCATVPDYRATIRRRRVTLTHWGPWLAGGGPAGNLVRQRAEDGIALADLTVVRDETGLADEVVVDLLCGDTPEVRASVVSWAGAAGYRRVWLPDVIADVHGDPRVGGLARTRCGNCGVRFADDDPDFWVGVRRSGIFPAMCPLCGGDLPQWSVRRGGAERHAATLGSSRAPHASRR